MIKQSVKTVLSQGLGWTLSAPLRPSGVVVLMYHRITHTGEFFADTTTAQFRDQMAWLKKHCSIISADDFADAIHTPIRRRPHVLVTFDDGYHDFYANAYPILQALKIPSLVFLATGFMDSDKMIWTDIVSLAFERSKNHTITLPWSPHQVLTLNDRASRIHAARIAKRYLKNCPDVEREQQQATLCQQLGINPYDGQVPRQMLSWQEVRDTMEFTVFGGHTHNHPIMAQISAAQADNEIQLCRDEIVKHTGKPPRYFAYPNGTANDFTEANKQSLKRHGFELAYSTIEGCNNADADLMAIKRQPTSGRTVADFAWLVAGH